VVRKMLDREKEHLSHGQLTQEWMRQPEMVQIGFTPGADSTRELLDSIG
jgi:hypothetical protein